MKKIKLRTAFMIQAEDTEWHEIRLNELNDRKRIVSHNKLSIIENAYAIEQTLESIITFHFFGRHEINKVKAKTFDEQILKSSWCSFESKRKLISYILKDLSAFENNNEQQGHESLLRKIMSYRNAFTHGQISYVGDKVKLTWFEGTTRMEFLSDDYLTIIESDFLRCFEMTDGISAKIGATTIAESLNEPLTTGQSFKIPINFKED